MPRPSPDSWLFSLHHLQEEVEVTLTVLSCTTTTTTTNIQNHFGLPLVLSPGFLSRYKTQNRSPGGLVLRHTRRPTYEVVPCTVSTILLSAANLTSMKLPDLETWRMKNLASERKREAYIFYLSPFNTGCINTVVG